MIEQLLPQLTDGIPEEDRRIYYCYYHQLAIDSLEVTYKDALLATEVAIMLHLDGRLASLSVAIIKRVLSSLTLKGVMTLAPNFSLYLDRITVPQLELDEALRYMMRSSLGTSKVTVLKMIGALSLLFVERLGGTYDPEDIFEDAYGMIDNLTTDPLFEIATLCYYATTAA